MKPIQEEQRGFSPCSRCQGVGRLAIQRQVTRATPDVCPRCQGSGREIETVNTKQKDR
jgi:DnaJ-class molecular chaperone